MEWRLLWTFLAMNAMKALGFLSFRGQTFSQTFLAKDFAALHKVLKMPTVLRIRWPILRPIQTAANLLRIYLRLQHTVAVVRIIRTFSIFCGCSTLLRWLE